MIKALKLTIFMFPFMCFSQTNEGLMKYINKYNECRQIQIKDVVKELAYARLGELNKPYRIYLEVEKDSLCHFTVLISPVIRDERKLIFEALDEVVKEVILSSYVKQTN